MSAALGRLDYEVNERFNGTVRVELNRQKDHGVRDWIRLVKNCD